MKNILIIEDDPIVARIYRSRLEKEGFVVGVAVDGEEGLARVVGDRPDAVLLDVMLPRLNGLELLKRLRALPEHQALPVFLFTNAYLTGMVRAAATAGATAVLNKADTTPRQIIDLLRAHLGGTSDAVESAAPPPPVAATAAPARTAPAAHHAEDQDDEPDFAATSKTALAEMRKDFQQIGKAADEAARALHVSDLCKKLGSHSSTAGMAGLTCVARLAAATQALVKEMVDRPRTLTPSTLKTTAHALDCLDELAVRDTPPDLADRPPIQVLVVEDEPLTRRALAIALERASITVVPAIDGAAALKAAAGQKFDLILLDLNLPGMDGLSLCTELRESGRNSGTAVVIVTSTTDLQARAQSTIRGASELIAKPFIFIELTVMALTYALRARAEQARQERASGRATGIFAGTGRR